MLTDTRSLLRVFRAFGEKKNIERRVPLSSRTNACFSTRKVPSFARPGFARRSTECIQTYSDERVILRSCSREDGSIEVKRLAVSGHNAGAATMLSIRLLGFAFLSLSSRSLKGPYDRNERKARPRTR